MQHIFEKFFIIAALFFTLGAANSAQAESMLRVVVYGDSLTAGYQLQANESYAARLDQKLKAIGYTNVEVINMSQHGQTSSSGLEGIGEVIGKRPDIVIVQLGTNDMLRGLNTDIIYKNLVDIVGRLQQRGIYVILFGVKAPESLGYSYVKQMEAVYSRLVSFYRIPFYANVLENISTNPDLTLADAFHPNGKGMEYLVENSFLLTDAGLRWKWNFINQQQEGYSGSSKEALPPPMPSTAEPPPAGVGR